tara:strand:+ start:4346 stop:4702 length:357 start_codon:yes stop_codon:yes gene_type:complete
MTVRIYGIRNCDTMKKAFGWLEAAGVAYDFHDYKKAGIDEATLARWCASAGRKALLNRRGTTWRKLAPEQQTVDSDAEAIALMRAHPSVIRRPVIETDAGEVLVGFDPDSLAARLGVA